MIKDILKKAKIGMVAIITAFFCITAPEILNVGAAIEGGTDIWLHIQTKEIDKNDIPDDRIVNLDISIENNPKIDVLGFIVEKDNRLKFDGLNVIKNIHQGISNTMNYNFENADNLIYNKVIFGVYPDEEDGVFAQIRIQLPDDADINDFYSVNILSSYDSAVPCVGIINPESNIIYGSEYFGGFTGGGIKITGHEPVNNDVESQPESVSPSDQSGQNQNNEASDHNNNSSNNSQTPPKNEIASTTTVNQTTSSLTNVVTTVKVTKATKATKVTSVSTAISTEYQDIETNTSAHTDKSDVVTSGSDKMKNNSKITIIICIVAITAVLASVLAIAHKNRKRRDSNEK